MVNTIPVRAVTVNGRTASWVNARNSELELIGFPAYTRSIFGIGNFIGSGWTGASKIQIDNKSNEIIELTEALGYRRMRVIDLDGYDSFEVRGSPNQYLMFFGFLTLWLYGLGLILIFLSYLSKHWFMVINFGFKSTTNERITLRISADKVKEAVKFCASLPEIITPST